MRNYVSSREISVQPHTAQREKKAICFEATMSAEELAVAILAGLNGPSEVPKSPEKTLSEDHIKKAAAKATTTPRGINVKPTAKSSTAEGKSTPAKATVRKKRAPKIKHVFPVEPRTIQTIDKPREYINHSYRDFSSVPAEIGYEGPNKIQDMNFSQKVHHMLSQDEYKKWISWLPHGRAFKVHVPVSLRSRTSRFAKHRHIDPYSDQIQRPSA